MALIIDSRARVGERVAHEAAVDLQIVDRQILQVRERTHAGAEIVERELAPEILQGAQEVLRLLEIADGGGLGQFEAQHIGRQLAGPDLLDHVLEEDVVLERLAGQIDREARDVLADRRAVLAQQFAGAVHHPAIHGRHELITLGGGQELRRAE